MAVLSDEMRIFPILHIITFLLTALLLVAFGGYIVGPAPNIGSFFKDYGGIIGCVCTLIAVLAAFANLQEQISFTIWLSKREEWKKTCNEDIHSKKSIEGHWSRIKYYIDAIKTTDNDKRDATIHFALEQLQYAAKNKPQLPITNINYINIDTFNSLNMITDNFHKEIEPLTMRNQKLDDIGKKCIAIFDRDIMFISEGLSHWATPEAPPQTKISIPKD